jgi:hypothetical protein
MATSYRRLLFFLKYSTQKKGGEVGRKKNHERRRRWNLLFLKKKIKKKTQRKKLQRREGTYLSSLASAFGMKHSSCVTTLTSGLRPKQRLARLRAKREAQESHCMLLRV